MQAFRTPSDAGLPLLETDTVLLADCEVDTYRGSGPGGQKRNKTESAVRLRHRSTGLSAIAEESRSQAENKARALKRLRKTMALKLRSAAPEGVPEPITACIDSRGRLRAGQRDPRYLPAIAALLDVLAAENGAIASSARRLGITTANLSAFIVADADLLVETNHMRSQLGLRPLRPN